jgi:alpha-ketoglutarate-dependent taurine dioxygenase
MPCQDDILQRIQGLPPEKRASLEKALSALGIDLFGRPPIRSGQYERAAEDGQTTSTCGPAAGTKSLPALVSPPRAGEPLALWFRRNREQVDRLLPRSGGALYRGFQVDGAAGFQDCIEAAAGTPINYAGIYQGVAVRKHVHGKVYTSTEFSPGVSIHLHCECSFAHCWPLRIFFYCTQASREGGQTPLADTRALLRRIDPDIRARFEKKGVMYVRNYGIGAAPSWKSVFNTGNRREVERICQTIGVHAEWLGETRLRTRSVRPAVVRHPLTGESVWFNHVNSAHVWSNHPALREALLSEFAPEDLPRNCYYGDGTEIDLSTLEAIREVYDQETRQFDWQAGDVLMLDNMLVAHGRQPYAGQRQVLVGMAVNVNRPVPDSMAVDVDLETDR